MHELKIKFGVKNKTCYSKKTKSNTCIKRYKDDYL